MRISQSRPSNARHIKALRRKTTFYSPCDRKPHIVQPLKGEYSTPFKPQKSMIHTTRADVYRLKETWSLLEGRNRAPRPTGISSTFCTAKFVHQPSILHPLWLAYSHSIPRVLLRSTSPSLGRPRSPHAWAAKNSRVLAAAVVQNNVPVGSEHHLQSKRIRVVFGSPYYMST